MKKASNSHEIDMVNGTILDKLIIFAIPVMLSGILQLLFNAADVIVVGRFAGEEALAAVGSTNSLINLLVNIFIGISVGTNVLVARYYGAEDKLGVKETVHTAILTAIISGIILIFIGILFTRPLLVLMGSPDNVLPLSAIYLKIYFLGMPATMLYNFGSAILRAIGDTKRPMIYLTLAGVLNVGLNLILVIVFNLGVIGVALATAISQFLSAALIIRALVKEEGAVKLNLKELRIHKSKLIGLLRVGLPAGMQGAIFSISNVLIQSSINSFGSTAMAGNTAAASIEGFVYVGMNAFHQTAVSFVSQNYGAGKIKRIKTISWYCIIMVTVVGLVMGLGAVALGHPLLSIYSDKENVIAYGILRLKYICGFYCLCGIMDTMVGIIRGLGYSIMPMIVSLLGACAFRILWIYTIFAAVGTLANLYVSYPISWVITAAAHIICLLVVWKRDIKRDIDRS